MFPPKIFPQPYIANIDCKKIFFSRKSVTETIDYLGPSNRPNQQIKLHQTN